MGKRIWMLRHGEREDVVNFESWKTFERFLLNRYDSPITIRGELQAKLSGIEIMKNQNIKNIKYCYCSPFTRTIETALETVEEIERHTNHKIIIRIEYALCEIPSVHLGWPIFENNVLNVHEGNIVLATTRYMDDDMTLENIYKKWERRITYFDINYNPISTFDECKYISSDILENFNRPIEIYKSILDSEQNNSDDILIVTHGMVMTSILSSIRGTIIGKKSSEFKYSGHNTCCLIGIEKITNDSEHKLFYGPSINHWVDKLK